MEPSSAHLRYLMAIYQLAQNKPEVSSVEVARVLEVSKPAVARMLKLLQEQELVEKKPYGRIFLTEKGLFLARSCQAYAEELCRIFPDGGLGLTPEEVRRAACAAVAALPQERFFEKFAAFSAAAQ
ncbi:MAG: MarR family transcriptional regulator [Oscillospiraceae bacterium]|nr:MarR family transcriptional regulator [Oscillospiraceae bacterium]